MKLYPLRDGVMLNDKHSLTDYGMVMKDRPIIGPPEPKTATVDVPGSDGVLDMTEAITGEVKFRPRPITLTFKARIPDSEQAEFESTLMDDLHGKRIEVILDEDPEWVWTGRAVVAFSDKSDWQETITISLTAAPYKLALEDTVVNFDIPDRSDIATQIGQDTSGRIYQSYFVFGEGDAPLLNLTRYQQLDFSWDRENQLNVEDTASIIFEGPDGLTHRIDGIPKTASGFTVRPYVLEGIAATIPQCKWIIALGLNGAVLTGTLKVVYLISKTTVFNERMPVCPIWNFRAREDVEVTVNGKLVVIKANEIYRDAEVRLKPGENEISISVPVATAEYVTSLSMRYRRGRL